MDYVSWSKVLTSSVVGAFGELTYQLLKDDAHSIVINIGWVQVCHCKALHNLIEQVVGGELLDKLLKAEVLKDLPRSFAKRLHVAH